MSGPYIWFASDEIGSMRRGSSGPPLPPVAGPVLWLRADFAPQNASVPLWQDISGNGNDATQTNASFQPTTGVATLNGKPGVTFDGVDDILQTAGVVTTSLEYSLFVVYQNNSPGGNSAIVLNGNASASGWGYFVQSGFRAALNADVAAMTDGAAVSTAEIWSSGYNGSNTNAYVDGLNTAISSPSSIPITPSGSCQIGNFWNISGYAFNGTVFEILIYPSTLSPTDRSTVEAYLGARYGITVTPPAQQVTSLTAPSSGGITFVTGGAGQNFNIYANQNEYAVWFNTGTETQPSTGAFAYIEVDILPTDVASDVQTAAINALTGSGLWTTSGVLIGEVKNLDYGLNPDASDNSSNFTISTPTQGN